MSVQIQEALRQHEESLLSLPNVTAVGIGERNGKEVILVFVREKVEASALRFQDRIPSQIEGFDTDVEVEIRVGSVGF